MNNFAFAITATHGSTYCEEEFGRLSDAIAHGKRLLSKAGRVTVGAVGPEGVEWLGYWSNDPQPVSWKSEG